MSIAPKKYATCKCCFVEQCSRGHYCWRVCKECGQNSTTEYFHDVIGFPGSSIFIMGGDYSYPLA